MLRAKGTEEFEGDPAFDLRRQMRTTYYSRFNAARRLRWHDRLSLLTISRASVVLLVLPVLEPFKIPARLPSGHLKFIQMLAAGVILVMSVWVSGRNFGSAARDMERCARDIHVLVRELEHRAAREENRAATRGQHSRNGITASWHNSKLMRRSIADAPRRSSTITTR